MEDNLEQQEGAPVRKGRRPSTIQELFTTESGAEARADVVMRVNDPERGFAKTINCRAGTITAFTLKSKEDSFEMFREALLGVSKDVEVSLRFGPHKLELSEVHSVTHTEVVQSGRTVEEALLASGVPMLEIRSVAAAVGLEKFLKDRVSDAAPKVIARLTAVVAVWSRSRIIYLDAPFRESGSEWAPALAHLLLESVVDSDRILILGRLERLPRVWKSSPLVEVLGLHRDLYDGDMQVVDETMGYLRKIQHLIGSTPADESLITTYPQRIFRRRTPTDSALCIEAISNPHVSAETPQQEETVAAHYKTRKKRKRKSTNGKLTRVTKLDKLRGSSVVMGIRGLLERDSGVEIHGAIPTQSRIQQLEKQLKRKVELEVMLIILLGLMTVLLALNWV